MWKIFKTNHVIITLYHLGLRLQHFALILFALLGGYSFTNYSLQDFLIFLALAFFCTIMGHSLLNWAIKFLPASSVSISILGEPVIASALAYFLFQETLTLQQLIGSILILGGILFYHYSVN